MSSIRIATFVVVLIAMALTAALATGPPNVNTRASQAAIGAESAALPAGAGIVGVAGNTSPPSVEVSGNTEDMQNCAVVVDPPPNGNLAVADHPDNSAVADNASPGSGTIDNAIGNHGSAGPNAKHVAMGQQTFDAIDLNAVNAFPNAATAARQREQNYDISAIAINEPAAAYGVMYLNILAGAADQVLDEARGASVADVQNPIYANGKVMALAANATKLPISMSASSLQAKSRAPTATASAQIAVTANARAGA